MNQTMNQTKPNQTKPNQIKSNQINQMGQLGLLLSSQLSTDERHISLTTTKTHYQHRGRPVFAADLCGMSDDYIDAALKQRKRAEPRVQSWPVVLCHDGLNDGRAEAIRKKYRAISYAGPMGHYVDLLLTIRAGFFIGNPASSFSHNGARVRYLMRPEDPATTITCEGMHRDPAYC